MSIIERQWASLKRQFGKIGNTEITRRTLSLGTRDATTGWRAKTWTESIITMFIIPQTARSQAVAAGYLVRTDALGLMDPSDDIEVGDEVKNGGDEYYEVKTVRKPTIGDKPALYQCDLKKMPLHQPGITAFAKNGVSQPFNFICYPSALCYNGVTYIVWQGDSLCPYAISYTHSSDVWAAAVKVSNIHLTDDDHGAPAICIDNDKKLHVFFGCHDNNIEHAKADDAESIAAWTAQADPTANSTYPKCVSSGANIYLFYRKIVSETNKKQCLKVSADNGANWGAEADIIDFSSNTWIYMGHVELVSGKIHMAWCYAAISATPIRLNIYHAYYNTADSKMYAMDGTDLGTTIDKTEADASCLVVDTGSEGTNHPALHVDGSGYPWIIYVQGSGTTWSLYHTRWTGAAWTTPVEITKTDNRFNYADFIITSTTNVDAYVTTKGEAGRGGEIERFNWDGTSWTKKEIILAETFARRPLNSPMVPVNFNSEIKLVFCQVDIEDYDTTDLKVYSYPT